MCECRSLPVRVRSFDSQSPRALDADTGRPPQGIDLGTLSNREVIHQATGIIMVRHELERGAAVDYLFDEADRRHCSLNGVARAILDSLTRKREEPHAADFCCC